MNNNSKPTEAPTTQVIALGWREWVSLPNLQIEHIKAKIDTGARTSALHTYFIEPYSHRGQNWVKFGVHFIRNNEEIESLCDAPVLEQRKITNSGGHSEQRFVIQTTLLIGNTRKTIELTLTNRDTMKFPMLVGRTALKNTFYVNPAESFLLGKPST